MTTPLKLASLATLGLVFALAIGFGSRPAAAISVEDSTGNPDVTAPLTDPDDAAGSTDQSGGTFTLTMPGQNDSNGNGLQWTLGTPSTTSGDGQ